MAFEKEKKIRKLKWISLVGASLLVGLAVSWFAPARPINEALARFDMKESSAQVQAMLAQYPDSAPQVYALYGQTPEFAAVLRKDGHNRIVPIITKCLEGGDGLLDLMGRVDQLVQAAVAASSQQAGFGNSLAAVGRALANTTPKVVTPEECGWIAVQMANKLGPSFLGEFDIDEQGVARRLPVTTAAALATRFFTSGAKTLERRWVRGESPTQSEWLMGGLDALGVWGVWKGLAHHFGAHAALKAGLFGGVTATASLAAKTAIVVGGVWLALTNPGVVLSALAEAGKQLGLPTWAANLVGAALMAFVVLALVSFLARPFVWLCGKIYKGGRRLSPKTI